MMDEVEKNNMSDNFSAAKSLVNRTAGQLCRTNITENLQLGKTTNEFFCLWYTVHEDFRSSWQRV
jgi:hypothetical protein